jgi:hypothetical protein
MKIEDLLGSRLPQSVKCRHRPVEEAEQRALKQLGIDPDEKTKLAEQKKKADQARRLASLNVGHRGLGRAVTQSQSWEETLRDTYDRIHDYRK